MMTFKKEKEPEKKQGFPFNTLAFRDNEVTADRFVYEEGFGVLFYNGEPEEKNLVHIGFGFSEPKLVWLTEDSYHYYISHENKTDYLYLTWVDKPKPFPVPVGGNCLLHEWTHRIGHMVGRIASEFHERNGSCMTVSEKIQEFERLAKEASEIVEVKRNLYDRYLLISVKGEEEWRPMDRIKTVEEAIETYSTYQKKKWGNG